MTRQIRFVTFPLILALYLGLLLATATALASDWPQFRGPNRDGHWQETKGILESFPKAVF